MTTQPEVTPTRDQCIQAAAQTIADYYGPDWDRIREGFSAAQPAA